MENDLKIIEMSLTSWITVEWSGTKYSEIEEDEYVKKQLHGLAKNGDDDDLLQTIKVNFNCISMLYI